MRRLRRFILVVLLLIAACVSAQPAARQPTIEVKVLVLNFDPVIPQEGGRRLHEVGKWHAPRELADGYIEDVERASGGLLDYRIVEWKDIDTFHTKIDGFRYTPEEYLRSM